MQPRKRRRNRERDPADAEAARRQASPRSARSARTLIRGGAAITPSGTLNSGPRAAPLPLIERSARYVEGSRDPALATAPGA
jgi:hypothetical protein